MAQAGTPKGLRTPEPLLRVPAKPVAWAPAILLLVAVCLQIRSAAAVCGMLLRQVPEGRLWALAARWMCACIACGCTVALYRVCRRFLGWWHAAAISAFFLASPVVERAAWRVMPGPARRAE